MVGVEHGRTSPAIEKTAAGLVERLFGSSVHELGELFADRVRAWRFRRLQVIADRFNEERERRGLTTRFEPVPPGLGLLLIEGVTLEDDPGIQTMWARLLLNHSDPSRDVRINKTLIGVLRQLEPLDARLLQFLDKQGWNLHVEIGGGLDAERIATALGADQALVGLSIANLWRLGCLVQQQSGPGILDKRNLPLAGPSTVAGMSYRPSPLGSGLLAAVSE